MPRRNTKDGEVWFSLASINQLTVSPRALVSVLGLQARKKWELPLILCSTGALSILCLYYPCILLYYPFSLLLLSSFLLHYYYPTTGHLISIYIVYAYQVNISNNYFYHVTTHPLKNLHCWEYGVQASLSEKWELSTVWLHSTCINFTSQYCLKYTGVSDRDIYLGTSPTMPSTFA